MESYLRQCNLEQQKYLTAANQIRTLNLFLLLLLLGALTILSLNITISCVFLPIMWILSLFCSTAGNPFFCFDIISRGGPP